VDVLYSENKFILLFLKVIKVCREVLNCLSNLKEELFFSNKFNIFKYATSNFTSVLFKHIYGRRILQY
jgi:hypothetical protein